MFLPVPNMNLCCIALIHPTKLKEGENKFEGNDFSGGNQFAEKQLLAFLLLPE